MSGAGSTIKARTITELRNKVQKWSKRMRKSDFEVDSGWNRKRVQRTKEGYSITVHASS